MRYNEDMPECFTESVCMMNEFGTVGRHVVGSCCVAWKVVSANRRFASRMAENVGTPYGSSDNHCNLQMSVRCMAKLSALCSCSGLQCTR